MERQAAAGRRAPPRGRERGRGGGAAPRVLGAGQQSMSIGPPILPTLPGLAGQQGRGNQGSRGGLGAGPVGCRRQGTTGLQEAGCHRRVDGEATGRPRS